MAGMKIVTVSTDAKGNVNMAELKEKVCSKRCKLAQAC
jgi:glycine cleavage system protein P-like pyridoxal-binding family